MAPLAVRGTRLAAILIAIGGGTGCAGGTTPGAAPAPDPASAAPGGSPAPGGDTAPSATPAPDAAAAPPRAPADAARASDAAADATVRPEPPAIVPVVPPPLGAFGRTTGPVFPPPPELAAAFAIQGEYIGQLAAKDGTKTTLGAEVGALGHDAFRVVFRPGGLPGEGWTPAPRMVPRLKNEPTGFDMYGRQDGAMATMVAAPGDLWPGAVTSGVYASTEKTNTFSATRAMPPAVADDLTGLYTGMARDWSGSWPVAIQVLKLPGGLRARFWRDAVPAPTVIAQYDAIHGTDLVELYGDLQPDGSARLDIAPGAAWSATVRAGVLSGQTADGGVFALQKVYRTSPTLGMKPPTGALIMFDGSNVDEWTFARSLKAKTPILEMGGQRVMVCGALSKRSFGDFTLHVEFVPEFMPDAHNWYRGNSGVFLMDRYEVAIGDAMGMAWEGINWTAGSIFKTTAPLVNASLPPLSWQTYDIDFVAPRDATTPPRVTVRYNGVLIHDGVQIHGATPHGESGTVTTAPLYLEWAEKGQVYFRNIWIVEKR